VTVSPGRTCGGYRSQARVTGGYRSQARVSGGYRVRTCGGYRSQARVTGGYRVRTCGGYRSQARVTGGYRVRTCGGYRSQARVTGGYRSQARVTGGYRSQVRVSGGYRARGAVTGVARANGYRYVCKGKTCSFQNRHAVKPAIVHRFTVKTQFNVKVKTCGAKINRYQVRLERVKRTRLPERVQNRKIKSIKVQIKRQKLIREKNVLRGRITRCAKTGKVIIVKNKPCPCTQTNINRWQSKVRSDKIKLREIRVQRREYRQKRLAVWTQRTKICAKTGQKVIVVRNKPCKCNEVQRKVRVWRRKIRVAKTNNHARVVRSRLTRCTRTGKVILVKSKPCPCTASKVRQWRHTLAVDRRRAHRVAFKVRANRVQHRVTVYRNRLAVCKKTGKVIVRSKPCACTDRRVRRWRVALNKNKLHENKIRRVEVKKQQVQINNQLKVWNQRKVACTKVKKIVVQGKPCGCKKVRQTFRRVQVRRRFVQAQRKELALKNKIVRCRRTGRVIVLNKKPCKCTKAKVNRWQGKQIVLKNREIKIRNRYQSLRIRKNQKKLRTWGRRVQVCAKTGKYIIVKNKKCGCKTVQKKYRVYKNRVARVEKRRVRQTHRVVVKTQRIYKQRCAKTGKVVVKQAPIKGCGCKTLKRRIAVFKTKERVIQARRQVRVYNNRIRRCKRTGQITITVKQVKKPCACSTATIQRWTGKVQNAKQVRVTIRREQKAKVQKKVVVLKNQIKTCKKTGQVIVKNKPCNCKQVRNKLIKAREQRRKIVVQRKIRVYRNRIVRCKRTGKPITITVKGTKKACNCKEKKIKAWRLKVQTGTQTIRIQRNERKMQNKRVHIVKVQKRLRVCKKTGKVIVNKKPCACTANRVKRWRRVVKKDAKKIEVAAKRDNIARKNLAKVTIVKLQIKKAACTSENLKTAACQSVNHKIRVQKRHIRVLNKEVKLAKKEEKVQKRLVKTEKRIKVLKGQLETATPKQAQVIRVRITSAKHQRRHVLRVQERTRVKVHADLKKQIKVYNKKITQYKPIVKTCTKTGQKVVIVKNKPCKCGYYRHWVHRHQALVKVYKTEKNQVAKEIDDSRKKHIITFRKIPAIPIKREIIVHRYNVKVRGTKNKISECKRKVQRLQVRYETSPTPALKLRIERQQQRADRLQARLTGLREKIVKTKSISVANCVCPTSCADELRKILNIIHINIVRGRTGAWRAVTSIYDQNIKVSEIRRPEISESEQVVYSRPVYTRPARVRAPAYTRARASVRVRAPAYTRASVRAPAYTRASVRAPVYTRAVSVRAPVYTRASVRAPVYTRASIRAPVYTRASIRAPAYTRASVRAPAYTRAVSVRAPVYTRASIRAPVYTRASIRAPAYTRASVRAPVYTRAVSVRAPVYTRAVSVRAPVYTRAVSVRAPEISVQRTEDTPSACIETQEVEEQSCGCE
jgi:hypothetical protein